MRPGALREGDEFPDARMTAPLSVSDMVKEAWGLASRAALPALPWLALWWLSGGVYKWALTGAAGGTGLALVALAALFAAGVQASLSIYKAMMPGTAGGFLPLAHANLAVYLAFGFIGFFVLFFTGAFGVMMLQLSGVVDLAAEPTDADVQAGLKAVLATPYGAALVLVFGAGMGGLCWLALRLTLIGAATVQAGQARVFRTWGRTKGLTLPLGLAALFTHVAPFLLGGAANTALTELIGKADWARFSSGVTGFVLLTPFVLAGHGLAVAALRRLAPAA